MKAGDTVRSALTLPRLAFIINSLATTAGSFSDWQEQRRQVLLLFQTNENSPFCHSSSRKAAAWARHGLGNKRRRSLPNGRQHLSVARQSPADLQGWRLRRACSNNKTLSNDENMSKVYVFVARRNRPDEIINATNRKTCRS